jgi:hypothetical protein
MLSGGWKAFVNTKVFSGFLGKFFLPLKLSNFSTTKLRVSKPILITFDFFLSETDELLNSKPQEIPAETVEKAVDVVDSKMSNSKELTKEKAELEQQISDGGIVSIIYSAFKKVAVVGVVYFIGYMNWSVAWLLCPLLLSVIRDQYRSKHDIRRAVAKASATANDKDVILARLNDLPAWVFFPDVERCEWLNRILKQVWPNANQFTRNLIKQSIEPNVQKALAAYKLNGFKFDRMILGSIVSIKLI